MPKEMSTARNQIGSSCNADRAAVFDSRYDALDTLREVMRDDVSGITSSVSIPILVELKSWDRSRKTASVD